MNNENIIITARNEVNNLFSSPNAGISSNNERRLLNREQLNLNSINSETQARNIIQFMANMNTTTKDRTEFHGNEPGANMTQNFDFDNNFNINEVNEDEMMTDFNIDRLDSNRSIIQA